MITEYGCLQLSAKRVEVHDVSMTLLSDIPGPHCTCSSEGWLPASGNCVSFDLDGMKGIEWLQTLVCYLLLLVDILPSPVQSKSR